MLPRTVRDNFREMDDEAGQGKRIRVSMIAMDAVQRSVIRSGVTPPVLRDAARPSLRNKPGYVGDATPPAARPPDTRDEAYRKAGQKLRNAWKTPRGVRS